MTRVVLVFLSKCDECDEYTLSPEVACNGNACETTICHRCIKTCSVCGDMFCDGCLVDCESVCDNRVCEGCRGKEVLNLTL